MINYDTRRFWHPLKRLRGSMLRQISARVLLPAVWSSAVIAFHFHVLPLAIPLSLHTLVGVAVSLLLVFRTNSSYDRFWEGRKLWGGIVNETRNLARAAGVLLKEDPVLFRALVRWTIAFPYASAAALRGKVDLGPRTAGLPDDELSEVRRAQHVPLAVAQRLSAVLDEGRRRGLYGEFAQLQLDQNVQLLIDYLGGCERIHKTPIPFAYMVHLRRGLILYIYTLPFALVSGFGWVTLAATLAVAYVFFGIEEIGVEIEDPFGHDDNDLPLDEICLTIERNLFALVSEDERS